MSGLAYKENNLYIVANNGKLYTFSIEIQDKKITSLKKQNIKLLETKKGKALKKKRRDAEGLCFLDDNLLISFERKHRVELYSTDGHKIKNIKISPLLQNKRSYKGKNRGLESVAYNTKYGVVTLPEMPLNAQQTHLLYTKDQTLHIDIKEKIKALEFISEDEILIISRAQSTLFKHKRSLIYYVDLRNTQENNAELLLEYNGNFEGLTKVRNNLYLMVTDSEGGFFQKAELVLFELSD